MAINGEVLDSKTNSRYLTIIGVLSVVIPIVVAILLFKPSALVSGIDVSFLPHLNAVLNSATAVCLGIGYYFIKTKNIALHKTMMITAFVLSSLFLISYVVYHAFVASTSYPGSGFILYLYRTILLSHILLSISIVYFALRSLYFGLTKQYEKHRKISKWTFPIWMYVAVTGVIVYLMISPYYPN
jgi:putative membrane protein